MSFPTDEDRERAGIDPNNPYPRTTGSGTFRRRMVRPEHPRGITPIWELPEIDDGLQRHLDRWDQRINEAVLRAHKRGERSCMLRWQSSERRPQGFYDAVVVRVNRDDNGITATLHADPGDGPNRPSWSGVKLAWPDPYEARRARSR